jgi:hypothetical protein
MATAANDRDVLAPVYEPADIMGGLYGDGIIGLKGAFSREWVQRLRADIEALYAEARQIPRGALPRGPQRWYVEVQPERISGFADITAHPWFVAVCEAVLGPDYRIVEVGFDIPFPGAADQPWHRDFFVPEATTKGRRLNSLAFNLTAVDTVPEMGPSKSRRHAVGPVRRLRERQVPAQGIMAPLHRPRPAEDAADGRHVRALGAHHPPRHRQPLQPAAAGAGGRRRRARRKQRAASRSPGNAGVSGLAAAACARPPDLPGGGRAETIIQHHTIEGLLEPASY